MLLKNSKWKILFFLAKKCCFLCFLNNEGTSTRATSTGSKMLNFLFFLKICIMLFFVYVKHVSHDCSSDFLRISKTLEIDNYCLCSCYSEKSGRSLNPSARHVNLFNTFLLVIWREEWARGCLI